MLTGDQDSNLYQQNTDFEIIEALLPYLNNKSFIDIGAEKGTFAKFLASHHINGTLFEPLPKFAHELNALSETTKSIFLPYAINDVDGTADFYSAYDHSNNPLDYFSSLHPLQQDHRIIHKKISTVTCRSLDSLLLEGCIAKQIGIVKIDTEGNDLKILMGMSLIEPEILMCEFFMPGIYAGWELGHPQGLIMEAKKLGFQHFIAIKRIDEYEFISMDSIAFLDQQWGNLIFINDTIYPMVKHILDEISAKSEVNLVKKFLETTNSLRKACEERLVLINQLNTELITLKLNLSDDAIK